MKNKGLISTIIFLILTIGFTVAVRTFNVAAVGPMGTEIGFADINKQVSDIIGFNPAIYELATLLGYVVIGVFLIFALVGLVQLIRRRSLLDVDHNILVLGGIYLTVFLLYVLFEKLVINYRPVMIPGETELAASFPSSHTMMAIVVVVGALMQLKYYINRKGLRFFVGLLLVLLMLATIATRILSGAHWASDIVAAVLYSMTLISAYCAVFTAIGGNTGKSRSTRKDKYQPKH